MLVSLRPFHVTCICTFCDNGLVVISLFQDGSLSRVKTKFCMIFGVLCVCVCLRKCTGYQNTYLSTQLYSKLSTTINNQIIHVDGYSRHLSLQHNCVHSTIYTNTSRLEIFVLKTKYEEVLLSMKDFF
jgi:hypothetical protein